MRTIPFYAHLGPFCTIIRFNKDGQCFQPPGVIMPDGEYQLRTAVNRVFGTFTVVNGQVSPNIHDELDLDLLKEVRGAVSLAEAGVALTDEFLTASERTDLFLDTVEAAIDEIDGRPNRHPEQLRAFHEKGLKRDNLLMKVGERLGESLRGGTRQLLQKLLSDPNPEALARSGRTDVAQLATQLARLSALLAWQPA